MFLDLEYRVSSILIVESQIIKLDNLMLILNYLLQLQKINIKKIFLIVYEYYYP